jgi:predicted Zn-dependent protease
VVTSAYGRSYHKAPAGNLDKAIELLERAVRKHPDFKHNQVFLADAYISKGRKNDAKQLLDGIVGGQEPENYKTLFHMIQTEARGLMAKV